MVIQTLNTKYGNLCFECSAKCGKLLSKSHRAEFGVLLLPSLPFYSHLHPIPTIYLNV